MKRYIVKYAYNHGLIESTMIVHAKSAEEAEAEAANYCDRVISVREDIKPDAISQADILNAAWSWYVMQWDNESKRLEIARNSGIDTEIAESRERRAWQRMKAVEAMAKAAN